MLFYYALAASGSSFIRRFKVQVEILWVEFLMNARLRAARILLVVYAHHVTSKSRDVRIYARVVHFNTQHPCHPSASRLCPITYLCPVARHPCALSMCVMAIPQPSKPITCCHLPVMSAMPTSMPHNHCIQHVHDHPSALMPNERFIIPWSPYTPPTSSPCMPAASCLCLTHFTCPLVSCAPHHATHPGCSSPLSHPSLVPTPSVHNHC